MYMREEVEAGIAFLDDNYPDWRSRINMDILDTYSLDDCIIGQVDRDNARYFHYRGFDILPQDLTKDLARVAHRQLTETWKYYLRAK